MGKTDYDYNRLAGVLRRYGIHSWEDTVSAVIDLIDHQEQLLTRADTIMSMVNQLPEPTLPVLEAIEKYLLLRLDEP